MINHSKPSDDDAVIGIAFRRSAIVIVVTLAIAAAVVLLRELFRDREAEMVKPAVNPETRVLRDIEIPMLPLTETTEASGIDFVHVNGATGEKLLPETMGSGCAFLDYDNDGDQDLFLVNSGTWPWVSGQGPAPESKLFQNDGAGRFEDVTDEVELGITTYGMGVAVGDVDNDGWQDIFISGVGTGSTTDKGANRFLRNVQGKFIDQTDRAGVAGAGNAWGTSCGWFDYDNDGLLDLFVCNYVQWSREIDLVQGFKIDGNERAYGPPQAFSGTFPVLYRNQGDGKFRDVSEESGIQVRNRDTDVPLAKGMGVAPIDVNNDGWLDVIMANDTVRNLLFLNQKNGTFQEIGELTGIAYDRNGKARGAMGIDVAWFRDDGTLAVGIGNFAKMSALYMYRSSRNQFFDAAMATGLGPPTRQGLTFGMLFCDIDLDGRIDVLGANGHLDEDINRIQRTQQYRQPPQLFWNAGQLAKTELVQVSADQTGASFTVPVVGRGTTSADIDADGDTDFLITTNGGPARLFRNDQSLGNHWIRLKLTGTQSNRDAIGAKVVVQVGDHVLRGHVMRTRSYLSQTELPLTFGLGTTTNIQAITVTWPSGQVQVVDDFKMDSLNLITEPLPAEHDKAIP